MGRWPNKYVIGLTGNIAVGKSVVRQMLQHLGAYTIDADGLAHQAMSPGAPAYKPVVQAFGQTILKPDKTIDRAALGKIVFSNPEMLKKLESITHPIIQQAINTLVSRAKQPVVVIEAIKLLEGDLANAVDTVWVVNAKPQTQYIRLVKKRKMSQEDAKQRILAQGAQQSKLKAANIVISNDGNIEETWKQVQAAFTKLSKPAEPPAAAATPKPAEAAPAAPEPKAQQPEPVQKPTTQPLPAQPAPAPKAAAPAAGPETSTEPITVKRGMPSHAEDIARIISRSTGKDVGRMDVIMSFGQKSYLIAESEAGATVGVIGWQVENLITRVDELYIEHTDATAVVYALVRAIEEASRELQSEVSFVFLPEDTAQSIIDPFLQSEYEVTTIKDIKIPAWREAVQEVLKDGTKILTKKLRKDRVLKPI